MIRRKPHGLFARKHGAAEPRNEAALDDAPELPRAVKQEGCGCAGAGFPLLAEVCETSDDILAICVLRFVLAGYCHDRAQCFDAAVDAAASVHGELYGLTLSARAMGLVRALRAERNGDFRYLPANCCRICEDEQELVAAMVAMRGENPLAVADAITSLAKNHHAPRIMQAVWAFSVMAATSPDVAPDTPKAAQAQTTFH